MAMLEQLVDAATRESEWTRVAAEQANRTSESPTCREWGRKGGSHYKDGVFTKK